MELTYIFHSGYAITTNKVTIIIDYYRDADKIVENDLLKRSGKIYVLCTHSHHDHFNPEILKWEKTRPDIVYIFSSEILDTLELENKNINYLNKLDTYKDEVLTIKAFGSTDLGGSFLIELEGKKI